MFRFWWWTRNAVWGARQLGAGRVDRAGVWPEFRELLHHDRPGTTRGVEAIVRAFECVAARRAALGVRSVWIQDWFWPDLATMPPGPSMQPGALRILSGELRAAAEPLAPVVLYLEVDPERALRRATADRGTVWVNRHAGVDPMLPGHEPRLRSLAAWYRRREPSRRQALHDAGWNVVDLDAGRTRSQVFADALTALRIDQR